MKHFLKYNRTDKLHDLSILPRLHGIERVHVWWDRRVPSSMALCTALLSPSIVPFRSANNSDLSWITRPPDVLCPRPHSDLEFPRESSICLLRVIPIGQRESIVLRVHPKNALEVVGASAMP